jgi:hypothetical protein
MHSYLLPAIARQREEDLAGQHGNTTRLGPRSHRLVTAAKTVRPGGEPTRSKPMILVALLLAAFR